MEKDSIWERVGLIQLYSQSLNHDLLFNFHLTLQINIESTLGLGLHLRLDIIYTETL